MFKIAQFDHRVFNEYFARVSSYEEWTFYFAEHQSEIDRVNPSESFGFSQDTFTCSPIPWNVLMLYAGEMGSVVWVLPFGTISDEFLAQLVSSGRAAWAT